jgi:hypothetical protein
MGAAPCIALHSSLGTPLMSRCLSLNKPDEDELAFNAHWGRGWQSGLARSLQRSEFGGIAAARYMKPCSSFLFVVEGCRMAPAAPGAVNSVQPQVQDH